MCNQFMRMLPETRIEATLSELLVKVLLCPRMLDSRLVDFQNLNAVITGADAGFSPDGCIIRI